MLEAELNNYFPIHSFLFIHLLFLCVTFRYDGWYQIMWSPYDILPFGTIIG